MMDTQADPCITCGSTDFKLTDGFYYCIECGTQNTNVRETVLEEKALADGTFAQSTRRKIVHIQKDGIEMSGEWYKWHAFNFIISGLADDLVTLGAKPTFKIKLLWIWTRYIKKYQNKEELTMNKTSQDEENNQTVLPSFMVEEDSNPDRDAEAFDDESTKKRNKCDITDGSKRDIKFLSKGLIIAMLYVALNLDESDIQLSHLYRFMQEKHLDVRNLDRFVPKEINVKKIPQWTNFLRSKLCTQHQTRALAMSLLRKLDLGTPKVPDLRKIIDYFLTELCLPNDVKPLVYSLMHYRRCDFLDIDNKSKKYLMRIPDYEGTVMSYILVAIKVCFGLDCDYEIRLSDIVDKINLEKDLPKSYKIGKYSEPSDRLFSFREWCSYLQFRKVMLSKYNLRIAEKNCLDVDDYVYLEHMEERSKNKEELSDKISMEIISKLPLEHNVGVIPKDSFIPTLTPLSEYTDIVIEYCQDPEVKLKLAEDFRRYSLKYACENLDLLDANMVNIIKGVSKENKTESKVILGTIVTKKASAKMVYIKNCENRNWMKTNPPTIEHVTCVDETDKDTNDKDSDHGYDSEITSRERDVDNSVDKSLSSQSITEDNAKRGNEDKQKQNAMQEYNDSEGILREKCIENSVENSLADESMLEKCRKDNKSEYCRSEIVQENNSIDNMPNETDPFSVLNKSVDYQSLIEDNTTVNDNNTLECTPNIIQQDNDRDDTSDGQDLEMLTDVNVSHKNNIEANSYNKNVDVSQQYIAREGNDTENTVLDKANDKSLNNVDTIDETPKDNKNTREEHRREIIPEENNDTNIFDDLFEDLTLKEECELNNINNCDINEDDNENGSQIQRNEIVDEDFDRRSDISDVLYPTFNPETFDRDRTIKELMLNACKKYKIPVPSEYKTKEPRKRKETIFGTEIPAKRLKRAKYEGKTTVKELLSNYYNYLQTDFVSRVQQEMSLSVRNSELEAQNNSLTHTNLQISAVDRHSLSETGISSPVNRSERSNTIEPVNEDLNTTNKTNVNDETGEIDINLENTLFEDDEEMQLDDLIPKGDPKFDEELYETDQLYIKVKEQDDAFNDVMDDPDIDKILFKKIDESKHGTEFLKTKVKPKEECVTKKEESDSEDEIPLSVFKEELLLIEDMFREEDKYERLIKQDVPEYNYWVRHYDPDFMLRSNEWHTKFDEELKENTPTSFYFVIQECALILNCSNFHLYKLMQNLEEYLISRAKNLKSGIQHPNNDLLEMSDESLP